MWRAKQVTTQRQQGDPPRGHRPTNPRGGGDPRRGGGSERMGGPDRGSQGGKTDGVNPFRPGGGKTAGSPGGGKGKGKKGKN